MRDADTNFVLSSWYKSLRASRVAEGIKASVYRDEHLPIIKRLIEDSVVLVATSKANDNQVYGWIAWDSANGETIVHYVYVKALFRRCGIAHYLFDYAGIGNRITATHRTWVNDVDGFANKLLNINYNPYLAYKVAPHVG